MAQLLLEVMGLILKLKKKGRIFMKVIIDRFEGDYAVVELDEGKFLNMPKELVPFAKEGDVIKITVDHEETKKRSEHITDLMANLFKD